MTVSTDTHRDAFVMGRGEGRAIQVGGGEVTIKISSRDTGGAFAAFEGVTQPLDGPPLHLHRDQDEWWYILEGEYRFEVDGREIHAGAGATVFAPRGSRHTFQNIGTTPGRTVTTVVPGGLDLFFEELATAVPRGTVPDLARLVPIFEKHGLELLGPPLAARLDTTASGAD
jgi:mannose-6-phosphate isomerase-like protein (cupin superfamily)